MWKPHALAKPHSDQLDLRLRDKVVATTELADVPAGTEGRVMLANGVELGDLDGRHIAPIGRAAKRLRKAAARR